MAVRLQPESLGELVEGTGQWHPPVLAHPIVDELAARIAANTQRRDGIHLERWKQ